MLSRLLLIYAVVELAVICALVSTIGWGWMLLALLAAFVLGWGILAPVASKHLVRRIGQLRSGLIDPRSAAGDGALVTLSVVLVLVPGLVSTALGLLLLVPPIRSVVGPRLTSIAVNKLQPRDSATRRIRTPRRAVATGTTSTARSSTYTMSKGRRPGPSPAPNGVAAAEPSGRIDRHCVVTDSCAL
ncbi:MAG: FxsA family protein [Mycobacterium sp.]|uniref:FxsA family protein n=1 Tax=Mycobacterium sp. TaxID=1785 RepID=UPI001ED78ED3|nr:FxsA family protein [Mycobacterium sp.]MBV8786578.1 FxsA family protein [Mycobacterium sp.]